jgi:uncharacterized phage protein gp47/JayE
MNYEGYPIVQSKTKKERELSQKLKKMLDEMKFRATPEKVVEFLALFEEFYQSKGVSKAQVVIKKAKKRQSETKSTEK